MTTPNPHKPRQSTEYSPLPAEDHFECLPGCGLCCSYRVLLTTADLNRTQSMDPGPGEPNTWLEAHAGEQALLREADFCVFLDPDQQCRIYQQRPNHCRTFPYLKTTYHLTEIDVDLSCPGLGHGAGISENFVSASNRGGTQAETLRAGVKELEGLLGAQQRLASPQVLTSIAKRATDKLADAWSQDSSASYRVSQPFPVLKNASSEADEKELWQIVQWKSLALKDLLEDGPWLERHFRKPRWNTRLDGQEVSPYRFWIAKGFFHLEERGKPVLTANLTDIAPLPWQAEALSVRQAYLNRWQKRQILFRLSANLAVARLLQGDHMVIPYLQFLTEIDHRLAVLATALARIWEIRAIDHTIALEAIRGSDGLLRAWCESARLGISD